MGVVIFLILATAFLCACAATWQLPTRRVHLGWLAVALYLLALLISGLIGETSLRGFNP